MVQWADRKYAPLLIFQLFLMVLFFIFVKYGEEARSPTKGFEDTHVMIFIGFGFLMTFLKKYCYSALGINLLLAALSIQWAVICQNFFFMNDGYIIVTKFVLIQADILSATVLITFGALLGFASCLQLLYISVIEIAMGSINLWLCETKLQVADAGGSMLIHAFGAYFGLGASLSFKLWSKYVRKAETGSGAEGGQSSGGADGGALLNGSSYVSDTTAMIGTLFLWVYWPSFNAALTSSDREYQRAVGNTYLSLAAATVTTFVVSSILNREKGKFDMVHVQNSTLAGGVAVGAICNLHIGAGVAVAAGMGSGVLSVVGYKYLTPRLAKCGILDTCGVNNLHGMPGVYSGILSVVFAALADKNTYGIELESIYEARNPANENRSAGEQAMFQGMALIATLLISFLSGIVSGMLVQLPFCGNLKVSEKYNDVANWELPH